MGKFRFSEIIMYNSIISAKEASVKMFPFFLTLLLNNVISFF